MIIRYLDPLGHGFGVQSRTVKLRVWDLDLVASITIYSVHCTSPVAGTTIKILG